MVSTIQRYYKFVVQIFKKKLHSVFHNSYLTLILTFKVCTHQKSPVWVIMFPIM